MKVRLDASAYSLLMRGDGEAAALARRAEEVLFSAVVVGELTYGFRRGARCERNAADLRSFPDSPYSSFVEVGPVTADRYARTAAALRAKGRPISDQRRLDSRPRHGDRRGPGFGGRSFRVRLGECLGASDGRLSGSGD